jgi:hypothetical protein
MREAEPTSLKSEPETDPMDAAYHLLRRIDSLQVRLDSIGHQLTDVKASYDGLLRIETAALPGQLAPSIERPPLVWRFLHKLDMYFRRLFASIRRLPRMPHRHR